MKSTYSALMQSRFFNPAFNSAIFDGPIRIYFAQFHESLALKIYFSLQQQYAELLSELKEVHRQNSKNLIVLIYPTKESFLFSFERSANKMEVDKLGSDNIIGVNGPFEDDFLPELLQQMEKLMIPMSQELLEVPVLEGTAERMAEI